jgi:dTDP-4-amino-4,6-dideoxygalactose transaminase
VPFCAQLTLKDFYQRPEVKPYPFEAPGVTFWFGASQAIYQGVRYLGLGDSDRVLAPAFCCGLEIDVLIKSGIKVDFYKLRPDLSPDLAHVQTLCRDGVRALLVTHFFGFPQPMEEIVAFAKEYGLFLIEDNAHGLYSEDAEHRPLGSFGDISVFSFKKTLPIPDGGALVIPDAVAVNNFTTVVKSQDRPKVAIKLAGKLKYSLIESLRRKFPDFAGPLEKKLLDPVIKKLHPAGTGKKLPVSMQLIPEEDSIDFRLERANWGMSWISRILLEHQRHERIRDIRVRNYELLLNNLVINDRIKPIVSNLPKGCCPWLFPVITSETDSLQKFLKSNGVMGCRVWPYFHDTLPQKSFPYESMLKRDTFVLPVHQDINEDEVLYLAKVVNEWSSRNG